MLQSWRLLILLFAICNVLGQCLNAQEMNIETLLKKMSNRTEKFGTLNATWQEMKLFPPNEEGINKPATVHLAFNKHLHFRYESSSQTNIQNLSSFDGKKNYHYTFNPEQTAKPQIGIEWSDKQYDELKNIHILPLMYYAFPLNALHPGFSATRFELNPEQLTVNGSKCHVLKSISSNGEPVTVFWIDPSKDFLIVKHLEIHSRITLTIEISYRQHEVYGWIPSEWTTNFQDDSPIHATIKEISFDPETPSSTFTFEFPTKTTVFDRDAGQSYYIRTDDFHRVITNEESTRGITLDQLEKK